MRRVPLHSKRPAALLRVPLVFLLATAAPTTALGGPLLATDDAGTLGRDARQLEAGVSLARDARSALATLGLGSGDDLDLLVGLAQGEESVVALDVKWRLLQAGFLGLALRPGLAAATGEDGRKRTTLALTLIASGEVSVMAADLNIGCADCRGERTWQASAAIHARAAPWLRLVGEAGGELHSGLWRGGVPDFVTAGAVFSLWERLDLAAGARVGLRAACRSSPSSAAWRGAPEARSRDPPSAGRWCSSAIARSDGPVEAPMRRSARRAWDRQAPHLADPRRAWNQVMGAQAAGVQNATWTRPVKTCTGPRSLL